MKRINVPSLPRAALVVCVLVLVRFQAIAQVPDDPGLYASIETDRGTMVVRLEPERAPMTVMNFVGLAEGTITAPTRPNVPFYDGLTFHRVVAGFVIQGGDPQGDGTGGPGYRFPTETHPDLLHDSAGVVAMANSGPDTNGSQFYITMGATPHLDGGYNVFGRVIEGLEVVSRIEIGDVIRRVEIHRVGAGYQAYRATMAEFEVLVSSELQKRAEASARARAAAVESIRSRYPEAVAFDDTGILIERTAAGSGTVPSTGTVVRVHLTMSLVDGTVLNDTRANDVPFSFVFGRQRLIEGLELVIASMKPGDRATAILPPELAFGSAGAPPAVPPESYIVFDVERIRTE